VAGDYEVLSEQKVYFYEIKETEQGNWVDDADIEFSSWDEAKEANSITNYIDI